MAPCAVLRTSDSVGLNKTFASTKKLDKTTQGNLSLAPQLVIEIDISCSKCKN
jgi:hypothetical protein